MLPFSSDTDTGDFALARGRALTVLTVPLHKVVFIFRSGQRGGGSECAVCSTS